MKEERIDALLQNARAGDQDAFTALYNATSQDVYQTIRSMVRSEQLALDIQQEVYIRAFTHLDQLEAPSKFSSWLRVIAVNQTRTELRKQTPILFTELEREDGPEIPEISDDRPEQFPELVLEQKETAELVQEILGSLTDSQRLLVGMYYYEQIPVTKIAEDLGVSPGTVKSQLSRSRKKVEAGIRALEEKGVRLFGLSPMPFLLALLRRLKPAEKAEKQVLADALTESGVAETAMIRVGTGFFHTIAGKALAGLTAVAIIGGGIAGFSWYRNRKTAPTVGDVQLINTVNQTDNPSISEDSSMQTEPQNGTSEETEEVIVTVEDSTEGPTDTDPTVQEPSDPAEGEDHTASAPMPTDPTAPLKPTAQTKPESTNPEPTDPEPTDPDPTEPESTEPKPIDPNPTNPEQTDPEPTNPDPTHPEPTDPEPTDPEPTDPEPSTEAPTDPPPAGPESTYPADTQPSDPEPSQPIESDSEQPPDVPIQTDPSEAEPTDHSPTPADPSEDAIIVEGWSIRLGFENTVSGWMEPATLRDLEWGKEYTIVVNVNKRVTENTLPAFNSDNMLVVMPVQTLPVIGGFGAQCYCRFYCNGPGTAHVSIDFRNGQILDFTMIVSE